MILGEIDFLSKVTNSFLIRKLHSRVLLQSPHKSIDSFFPKFIEKNDFSIKNGKESKESERECVCVRERERERE